MAQLTTGMEARIRWLRPATERPWTRPYDRHRDLPRLLPLFADEMETPTAEAQARLLGLLRRGLRAERRRGYHRHWTYDPGRHAALLQAWRAESAMGNRAGTSLARR